LAGGSWRLLLSRVWSVGPTHGGTVSCKASRPRSTAWMSSSRINPQQRRQHPETDWRRKNMVSKRGRPSDYNAHIAAEICGRIAEGQSLREICAAEDMPSRTTVFRWLA